MNNTISNNIILLIPAHNPDEKLLSLIDAMKPIWKWPILIVNDGSSPDIASTIFPEAEKKGAIVVHHETNKGKGRALKTGFKEIIQRFPDCIGCITADADGQHLPKDILATAEKLLEHPNSLVLGCRDFDKAGVPARSQFGNKTTRIFMRLLCGVSVTDTQTGLRGISLDFMQKLLDVQGERFDFETNMLLETNVNKISIHEVTIDTVYIEQNRASHFRPIRDSINIYGKLLKYCLIRLICFIKYCGSSLICFFIDLGLFTLFSFLFDKLTFSNLSIAETTTVVIFISTALARIISAIVNFLLNRFLVFKSKKKAGNTAVKYVSLAIIQMLCSAGLVALLAFIAPVISKSLWKILVDFLLFFISFKIQKIWVF